MSFIIRLVVIALLFYLFALLESGFLVSFAIYNVLPNLILGFIIVLLFIDEHINIYDLLIVLAGGFFLDLFSTSYFGILSLDLLCLFFFLKIVLSVIAKKSILFLILILMFSILFYDLFFSLINTVITHSFKLESFKTMIIEFLYDLPFTLFFYYCLSVIREKRQKVAW